MVKLTDYGRIELRSEHSKRSGVAEPIERWEKQQAISIDSLKDDDDKSNAKQRTSEKKLIDYCSVKC